MCFPEDLPEDIPEAIRKEIEKARNDEGFAITSESMIIQENIISTFILDVATHLFYLNVSKQDVEQKSSGYKYNDALKKEIFDYIGEKETIINDTIEGFSKRFIQIYFAENDAHEVFPMMSFIKSIMDAASMIYQKIEEIRNFDQILKEGLDESDDLV